jgi:hypothetical protein
MNPFYLSLLIFLIFPIPVVRAEIPKDIQKHQIIQWDPIGTKVQFTLLNINNLAGWIGWDGTSGNNPYTGYDGVIYPRGTGNVVFQDGLLWGGFINDGKTPILRVGGQRYNTGTAPGRIIFQGVTQNSDDPQVRIYRIRRDYLTVTDTELLPDAAEFFDIPVSQVSPGQIDTIRANYTRDWQEWPVEYGAPFYDNNENGIYEPGLGEEPGLQMADQVIWLVCNDLDSARTDFFSGSPPFGLELQVTFWGYKMGGPLGQTSFHRYRLINKSGFPIDSMFIAQFTDSDIGVASNDLCGCDSLSDLAYTYNGYPTDVRFTPFDLSPPAIGYCLLQGPLVPSLGDSAFYNFKILKDFRNLPMTSFYYGPCGWWDDIWYYDPYDLTLQWYNLMNGYLPIAYMYSQLPFTHRSTGKPTKFPLNGNPVTGTGDIDGQGSNFAAGERISGFSSGPFQMLAGDTQEVVIALIGGIDPSGDHISSLARLKQNVKTVRDIYKGHLMRLETNYQLDFPTATVSRLKMEVNLGELENLSGIRIDFRPENGNEAGLQMTLYDDGQHNDGAAGDGKWGNVEEFANRQYPYQADLLVDYLTVTDTVTGLIPHLQLRPTPVVDDFSIVYENGRQDGRINYRETVHLAFQIENRDGLNPIHDLQVSTLPEEAALFYTYRHDQDISAGGRASSPAMYAIVMAPTSGDSLTFRLLLKFDGHLKLYPFSYPIIPWEPAGIWQDTLQIESVFGPSDYVLALVADPTLLTGHDYLLTFSESPDTSERRLRWNLLDRTTDKIKLQDRVFADSLQCNHPVVDGIEFQVYNQEPDFRQFLVVANAEGVVDPPDQGCFAFNANGFPFLFNDRYPQGGDRPARGVQQGTNNSAWGIHTSMNTPTMDPSFEFFKQQVTREGRNWEQIGRYDYELRFTAEGGKALMAFTSGMVADVPFALWNIGIGTWDDASDDYRMIPLINDEDGNEAFSLLQADHSVSGGDNDPYTDGIYWWKPPDKTPGQTGYEASLASGFSDVEEEAIVRMVLVNWNGGSVSDTLFPANLDAVMPEEGTIFRIVTNKPNRTGDSLLVRTPPAQPDIIYDWPQRFQLVQNYPNPFNSVTTIPFELSEEGKVRIELYNILGQRVMVLKDEVLKRGRYEVKWDGRNSDGIPLASGIYIIRMEINNFQGSHKIILLK